MKENIGSGKNGQQEQPSKAVEYLDPVQNFDDVSSGSSNLIAASDSNIPSKLRNGRVEYALVNEESTQVFFFLTLPKLLYFSLTISILMRFFEFISFYIIVGCD